MSSTRSDLHRVQIDSVFQFYRLVDEKHRLAVSGFIRASFDGKVPAFLVMHSLWYFLCFDQFNDDALQSFDEMELKHSLLRGIYYIGFEKPSIIQQKAIVPFLRYQDITVHSRSGTGKSAICCIAALQAVDETRPFCQSVILCPERSFAAQLDHQIKQLSTFMEGITQRMLIGGKQIGEDVKALQGGTQIVIGTPGRILHLHERKALDLSHLRLLMFYECDELLSKGFEEQMLELIQRIPKQANIGIFSATMPQQVKNFAETISIEPVHICSPRVELTLDGVRQFYVNVEKAEWKLETLFDLMESITYSSLLIYVNSTETAQLLEVKLTEKELPAKAIHDGLNATERDNLIKQFRSGSSFRILISTDLNGRGVNKYDLNFRVSLVLSYDLPQTYDVYLSRIGRSGKYGRQGSTVNFITSDDTQRMRQIEQYFNTRIDELPMDVASLGL